MADTIRDRTGLGYRPRRANPGWQVFPSACPVSASERGFIEATAAVECDLLESPLHDSPSASSQVSRSASAALTHPPDPTAMRSAVASSTGQWRRSIVAMSSVVGAASLIDWKRVWNRSVSRSSCRLLVPITARPAGSRSR